MYFVETDCVGWVAQGQRLPVQKYICCLSFFLRLSGVRVHMVPYALALYLSFNGNIRMKVRIAMHVLLFRILDHESDSRIHNDLLQYNAGRRDGCTIRFEPYMCRESARPLGPCRAGRYPHAHMQPPQNTDSQSCAPHAPPYYTHVPICTLDYCIIV